MDALKVACEALAARIIDPKARFIPGLADDLRAVLLAFEELDRRTELLASCVLQKHYWPSSKLTKRGRDALIAFGAEAATVGRRADHSPICTCSECMQSIAEG